MSTERVERMKARLLKRAGHMESDREYPVIAHEWRSEVARETGLSPAEREELNSWIRRQCNA